MDFLEALRKKQAGGGIPVIPDIKCYSPKEGELMGERDPAAYAVSMESAGAPVLSVVTEEKEFHGSLSLLGRICSAVSVPVLRKDFVRDIRDLEETKEAGASAILLMYSCLGRERLHSLYEKSLSLGLVPFVETHTEEELRWAGELKAALVGINNRDILQLERDDGGISHAVSLMEASPKDAFVVVESGLKDAKDVRRAVRAGADAVLVGTSLLKAPDPEASLKSMQRPCSLKICGLMNREGVELCLREQVDLLGFVTEYPVPVPWNLSLEEARRLLTPLREAGQASRTCIVTGGSPEKVISLARDLKPAWVQLHYRERPEEIRVISEALHKEGIRVIRSIPSDLAERRELYGTDALSDIFRILKRAGVDAGLLDSRDAGNAARGGGSILEMEGDGEGRFDLKGEGPSKVIGGGITGENAWEAYERFAPDMIDVMTGAENAPGQKDEGKIRALVEALTGKR